MVKLTICVVRKADLSHEQFDAYWRDTHGPLVKSVSEFTRHIRRYVQCHGIASEIPLGAGGQYDGIAELWFDDVASIDRAFSEPRYLEIIRPDELKFVDLDSCMSYISDELEVIGS
jgi:uncharacterized protein (TIGR02118 family)